MSDQVENKEYKVLARKYRPQKFDDLIGQETLVKTLTNSFKNKRIAHAYLLTGVRGIGKTTTARLIAMTLNCEKITNEICEPCGNCNSCDAVRDDSNLDVIEMDAASKTGVDDIREIIDNIKYKPINNKYKIFIIDEVHMLSKNAFNALLKTLEEPPAHVKFIFATTEVKKIPITIISRCQRFDLHRINKQNLTDHLIAISKKEEININEEALALIVRSADGSVRDALSLLDQSISNSNNEITADSIIHMLGLANRANIFDLMNEIFAGNALNSLEIFNRIYHSGADVLMIFSEMLNVTHFITQIKILPDLKNDIHIPELERQRAEEIASKISLNSLGIIWQVLFKGYQELQLGFHLFQHGEMIILRLIHIYNGPSPDELIKEIISNKKNLNITSDSVKLNLDIDRNKIINQESNKNEITDIPKTIKLSANFKEDQNIDKEKNKTEDTDLLDYKDGISNIKITSFRHFVDLFYQKREAMIHTYLYNNVTLINFKEGEIVINTNSIADPHFTRTISKLVSKWTGRIWQISKSTSNIGNTLYEEDLIEQKKEIEKMKTDKEIKKILDNFPGVTIHSITNINETTDEDNVKNKLNITKEH